MNNGCAAPLWMERLGSGQARLRGASGAGSGGRVWESLLIGLISHTDTAASEILI